MAGGVRIGLVQSNPVPGQRERNVEDMLALAAPLQADLIVYPELASSGYAFDDREALLELAERPEGGGALAALQDLAEEKAAAIVAGLPLFESGRLFNAAALLRPQRPPVFYRKLHLFNREQDVFDAGDRPPSVHSWGELRLGMMICFDWIFPETARLLALAGADLIAHPANLVLSYCQDAMRTRSLENSVFSVTVNRVGRERYGDGEELCFAGKSQVIDPRGRRLLSLGASEQTVVTLPIDPERARDKALTPRNHLLADRLPEQYRALTAEGTDES